MKNSADILQKFRHARAAEIDLTLRQSYRNLLQKLGNPHLNLPPVIHVAGTNGKGSVCAFLRSAAEAAGLKAHVYTSPHLVHFNERIRIAGKLIEEPELAELLNECWAHSQAGEITFFEAATACAFAAFARNKADLCIIEVGLGGRLDATNVIPKPAATVITRLSYDHREFLGETLAAIAAEKAGIMRSHVPSYAAFQPDESAMAALKIAANTVEAPFFVAGVDWQLLPTADGFAFIDKNRNFELPLPKLLGLHQMHNAGLALAALQALPFEFDQNTLSKAMLTVDWPGRLQPLQHGRLADLLPKGWELWLDGGHNDSAGEILAAQMDSWKFATNKKHGPQTSLPQSSKPNFLVYGMLQTKVPAEFLAPMADYVSGIKTVNITDEPLSRPAEDLAAHAKAIGIENAEAAPNILSAIQEIVAHGSAEGRILICGSLYLVGQALRLNATE